ncbi:low affinity iron permease family protein [Sphaerisporangium fuscum]|uniref:low affinity iron permease family protein n=1 Tax=Sphaerisporangium fuscum TaxID=2835868 RepID=UPI001BDBEEE7|nr:low affinity iron permease family protein [Sphaerisporangium fuscum]
MTRHDKDTRDDPRTSLSAPTDRSTRITRTIAQATALAGSFPAIIIAVVLVVAWAIGGLFVAGGYGSTAYQLPVSTISSIVTFVMVFVIQSSQNRDTRALQAKADAQSEVLNAIARHLGVEDEQHLLTRLVGLEEAPEREIDNEQEQVRRSASRMAGAVHEHDDRSGE